jgi:hypothetical protein
VHFVGEDKHLQPQEIVKIPIKSDEAMYLNELKINGLPAKSILLYHLETARFKASKKRVNY